MAEAKHTLAPIYQTAPSYAFAGWTQVVRNGQIIHHYPTMDEALAAIASTSTSTPAMGGDRG